MIKTRRTRARLVAVATAAAAAVALCAGVLAPAQSAFAATHYVTITSAGSTWSQNAIDDWIAEVAQNGLTVKYAAVGATAGRSDFAHGTVDFATSEIPYGVRDGKSPGSPPARGYAYLPDMAGGLAFMYNLTIGGRRVTNLRLSGAVIAGIFTGKIIKWDDPKIKADDPRLKLPATRIVPVVSSESSGTTAEFTQWMLATQAPYWNAYCKVARRSPCTQTSAYPVDAHDPSMVSQAGDTGVAGFVSQHAADGAIGYVAYSDALETGFPVAKVLNAAGYYTLPTAGNVAVSLLRAQINTNKRSRLYLAQNLSRVYSDPDPRAYDLSFYSYMILPTTTQFRFSADEGYTLSTFGEFLECQGQQQVDSLGYSALPVSLVKDGFAQLKRIPGSQVPTPTTAFIQQCNNPTYSANGTNALADHDPRPPACDKRGPTQCAVPAGGAAGAAGSAGRRSSKS